MFLFCSLFTKESDYYLRNDIDILVDELLNIEGDC